MAVYVVQEVPGRNLAPALQYGELTALLPSGDVVLSPGPMVRKLQRKLKDFCDADYLLLAGDPVAIGMATAVASQMNRGKLNVLKWDRQSHVYFPVRIDINQRLES